MTKSNLYLIRCKFVLILMWLFGVKLHDLYDSYPYNPYSEDEAEQYWRTQLVNSRFGL